MITLIKRATIDDYIGFFGLKLPGLSQIIPGWVVYQDGQRVGLGGLSYQADTERWWAYLNVKGEFNKEAGIRVVREMMSGLKMIPHDVYVLCDENNYAMAPRLLRILGFEPTDESNFGLDVWVHRATEGE